MKKLVNIGGYIGMILLQGAIVPTIISVLLGYSTELPPLSLTLLLVTGLLLYLIHSIVFRITLYIISNSIGFILYSITAILTLT